MGFTGYTCSYIVTECSINYCQNNGNCTLTPGGFYCTCPPNFIGQNCSICNATSCLGSTGKSSSLTCDTLCIGIIVGCIVGIILVVSIVSAIVYGALKVVKSRLKSYDVKVDMGDFVQYKNPIFMGVNDVEEMSMKTISFSESQGSITASTSELLK
eukprot:Em0005g1344a